MPEKLSNGWSVEKEWTTTAGYEARIHHYSPSVHSMSIMRPFFTGYVKVTKGMRLFESKESYPDFSVHGGVTFFNVFFDSEEGGDHKWIGFDCNHSWDECDPKGLPFVECECEHLAEQIKEHEAVAETRGEQS